MAIVLMPYDVTYNFIYSRNGDPIAGSAYDSELLCFLRLSTAVESPYLQATLAIGVSSNGKYVNVFTTYLCSAHPSSRLQAYLLEIFDSERNTPIALYGCFAILRRSFFDSWGRSLDAPC
jgi:hypothetical protein